jgi:hypothetical protein
MSMLTISYTVKAAEKDAEVEWLREQKVYPSYQECYDFVTFAPMYRLAMIVNEEAALAIKLRHKIDIQKPYRQR